MENNLKGLQDWANNLQKNVFDFQKMVDGMMSELPEEQKTEVKKELEKLEKSRGDISNALKKLDTLGK